MAGAILGALRRMLESRPDRDGQAAMLEQDALLAGEAAAEATAGRRERRLGLPRDVLDRSLSQKVLHGWLQNRHQVLVPLTFRLGRLDPEDSDLLMRFAAASLLNGASDLAASRRALERWLGEVGAAEAVLTALEQALAAPQALNRLIEALRTRNLEPYAYAVAVVAVDDRDAAGRLYADYVAARLGLAVEAIRSIDRRYRR